MATLPADVVVVVLPVEPPADGTGRQLDADGHRPGRGQPVKTSTRDQIARASMHIPPMR
ncbi:hypothetical protein GCM10014713_35470 [Streptomyces purpureus]|uniref:Uncharacterized protein n=1 Tax=Streptomyces purpureus TaxID=1951 RepID=A0A918H506_9ACTN|nr:hypothetical protein GCM10014713_35470 [Streptomyces purpureus]